VDGEIGKERWGEGDEKERWGKIDWKDIWRKRYE
jgi:hypothetical protein